MAARVKRTRRRGHTRVSPKHQVTLTADALTQAGLRTGDELRIEVVGPGRVMLTRTEDALDRFAGTMPAVFPVAAIKELRNEWR